MPNLPLEAIDIPQLSGVYFLLDSNGDIMYIGASVNVSTRIRDHKRGTKNYIFDTPRIIDFATAVYIPVDREKLGEIEKQYIIRYDPPFNKRITGHR